MTPPRQGWVLLAPSRMFLCFLFLSGSQESNEEITPSTSNDALEAPGGPHVFVSVKLGAAVHCWFTDALAEALQRDAGGTVSSRSWQMVKGAYGAIKGAEANEAVEQSFLLPAAAMTEDGQLWCSSPLASLKRTNTLFSRTSQAQTVFLESLEKAHPRALAALCTQTPAVAHGAFRYRLSCDKRPYPVSLVATAA